MNAASLVTVEDCCFLIMDAPTQGNLEHYIHEMDRCDAKTLVRACQPTYSARDLDKHGIKLIDLAHPDGHPPSKVQIQRWLQVVRQERAQGRPVAVHCVAGLGRAPVLVAIALMEVLRMDPLDAIELIRKQRRGAINLRQCSFLKKYQCQPQDCGCSVL